MLVRKVLPDGGAALRMMLQGLREGLDDRRAIEKAVLSYLARLETTTNSLVKAARAAPQLPYWVAGDHLRAVALALLAWAWVRIRSTPGNQRWQAPGEALRRWVMPEFDMRLGIIENEIKGQDCPTIALSPQASQCPRHVSCRAAILLPDAKHRDDAGGHRHA
ncbi:hypothetical protein LP417_18385 [Polaromonas sp. P1-6]|nr:hypothetical protein LP417_18385 [Polaromonas sp. P1-6]